MRPRKTISYLHNSSGMRFEGLEPRQHFSATALPAIQVPVVQMDRINPRLLSAVNETLAGRPHELVQNKSVRFDDNGAVQMYVRTSDVNTTTQRLQQFGAKIDSSSVEMGVVQAWLAPAMIDDALNIPAVQNLDLPDYAVTNITSAGDSVMLTDQVRARFNFAGTNFDGTGIKIGVISDGVNHRANVGAELPAVTVNPALPGNGDEGTAMLEIVHDLVPGAQLYFSGPQTSVDMVSSINYLKAQGCDVIVDDLLFLGEHFFSDTSVANAAKQAVADGVVYVTSAGNFGTFQHYQAQYSQSNSAFGGGLLHRFAQPSNDANSVTIPAGSRFRAALQWGDAYGQSANDYDLYLFNSSTFAQLGMQGTSIQNGNDIPFELVDWTNNTANAVQAELWIVKKTGAASRELELITVGNTFMEFQTQSDCLVSQEAVPEVISVGAVRASTPNTIEAFSSRGGSTIYTNFSTQTKTLRANTLDGVATDGVETKVGQLGFFANPFFGTSAAAPHAAAIAALVKDANPSLTPAQVAQIMADTAADLGSAGYDTTFGAGRYNALNAVYKAYTANEPDIIPQSDSGISNTDNYTSDETPAFSGAAPAGSFVELFVDGVFKSSAQLGAASTNWSIISPLIADGAHTATIRVSANSSIPTANRSQFSTALPFTIDTSKPAVIFKGYQYNTPQPRVQYMFSEQVVPQSVPNFNLDLFNHTTNSAVDDADVVADYDTATKTVAYTFPTLAPNGSLPEGNYSATLVGGLDIAFNLMLPSSFDFFVLAGDANRDRMVDIGDFSTLAANFNSGGTFSQGDFDYSGQVDIGDFSILASKFNTSLPEPDAQRAAGQPLLAPRPGAGLFSDARIIASGSMDDLMA